MRMYCRMNALILALLLVVTLNGCGAKVNVSQVDIGVKTITDFNEMASSKGYREWYNEERYGYKIIGWNKPIALPYYAVFDNNDLLVEFLGTNPPMLNVSLSEINGHNLDLDRIKVIRLAKEKESRLQKAKLDILQNTVNKPFVCVNSKDCKKAFSLTQIYISENAEMKIQTATDTIIETYGSNKNISMKATKVPGKGDSEEIYLRVFVPYSSFSLTEKQREIDILRDFHRFLSSRM